MEKAELRRSLLQTRRSLSTEDWQKKSWQICDYLQADPVFQQAQTVLSYFSFRQEPDLNRLLALEKNWGFSRCVEKSLVWHRWYPNLPLRTGAYGILEPHPDASLIEPEAVDLILVPCVGWDDRGYRLGYGGGFYDRLLSAPEWREKVTIGITFAVAHLPALPVDEWDKPLQGICTEKGLLWISN